LAWKLPVTCQSNLSRTRSVAGMDRLEADSFACPDQLCGFQDACWCQQVESAKLDCEILAGLVVLGVTWSSLPQNQAESSGFPSTFGKSLRLGSSVAAGSKTILGNRAFDELRLVVIEW
jgi:hypothetical protein